MNNDSGRLAAGTQLENGFSPLNTDAMTKSVEAVMDNENATSDSKPETPNKSEKPSFDRGDSKQKLEEKSLSTKNPNTAKGKTPEQLSGDINDDSVKNSHPSKQRESNSKLDVKQMATIPPKPSIPGPRKIEPEATAENNGIRGASGQKSIRGVAKQRPEQKPETDVNVGRNGRISVRSRPKQPTSGSSDLVKTNELPKQAKDLAENKEFMENEYSSVLEYVRLNIKKETYVAKQEVHKDHNRYTDIVPFDDNHINLPANPKGEEVTYVN